MTIKLNKKTRKGKDSKGPFKSEFVQRNEHFTFQLLKTRATV